MPRESNGEELDACPIHGVIDVIGKKWAMLIIVVIGSLGRARYNEILHQLRGISPKTLADTLKELERAGIVNRKSYNEIPPRVEYSLTDDGAELRKAIIPLLRWAIQRSNKKECVILGRKL